jgi:hypothetical protein
MFTRALVLVTCAAVSGEADTGKISSLAQAGGNTFNRTVPFSDATSSVTYRATYANNTASAQGYSFNFLIDSGALGLLCNDGGGTATSASVLGSIAVNGATVWSTQATLGFTPGDRLPTFTTSGTNIGYSAKFMDDDFISSTTTFDVGSTTSSFSGNAVYTFGGYKGSVSMGVLGAGESVDVTYTLQNTAIAKGSDWYGGAISYINDPVGLSSVGVSVTAVPEPETVAMLTAGLALLAVRSRKRKFPSDS